MRLKGSRVLARIAAREVLRARGRSALIVAMIALPVALVVTGSILHRTTTPTPQEQISRELGTADLRIDHDTGDTAWLEALPTESRVVTHSESFVEVAAGGQFRLVRISDMSLDDPLTSGHLVLVGGSAPRTADEASVSPSLLDAAGIEVGETLRIEGLPELRVSGEVVQPHYIHGDLIVVGKGGFEPGPRSTSFVDVPAGAEAKIEVIADEVRGDAAGIAPGDEAAWDDVQGTRQVLTADLLSRPADAGPLGVIFLFGGLALFEAALVAGAAFAVGARRQLRSYGLLGAVGADERHIRLIVLMSGVGLGGVGALAGTAAGLGVAFAASPWIDLLNGQYNGPLTIAPLDYLGIMTLGVVAATASALIPARSAGRVSVLEALAGRRPVPARTGVRWARAGLFSALGGATMVVAGALVEAVSIPLVLAGTIAIVAGFAACSPLLIAWVAKHAHRTPAPLRIALRDSGRNAHRGGPTVAAIMSALTLAVTLSTFIASREAGSAEDYVPWIGEDQVLVAANPLAVGASVQSREVERAVERLRNELDIVAQALLVGANDPQAGIWLQVSPDTGKDAKVWSSGAVVIGGADVIGALGGDAEAFAKSRGSDAFGAAMWADDGSIELEFTDAEGMTTRSKLDFVDVGIPPSPSLPSVVISPEAAARFGLDGTAESWVLRSEQLLTTRDHRVIRDIARDAGSAVHVAWEQGYQSGGLLVRHVALAISALTAFGVLAAAVGLSAAESKAEWITMSAIGMAPKMRRTLAASQAFVFAGLGAALAIPGGLIPALAVLIGRGGHPIVLPWDTLLVVAFGVPAVAAAGAWLLTRPGSWVELRRT